MSATIKKPIRAWLVTRGPGLYEAITKGEVVDIISARASPKDIQRDVQRLHDRACFTLSERAEQSRYNQKEQPVYNAEINFHTLPNVPKIGNVPAIDHSRSPLIHCGHDPCFAAQLVKNLVVERDSATGQERVTWEPWTPTRRRPQVRG